MGPIFNKVARGERIDDDEWRELWRHATLYDLGRAAHQLRLKKAPPKIVSFIIDRNINYTNICVSGCSFCAFYRRHTSPEGYVISESELFRKIEEAVNLGASQVLLQGGMHPDLKIDYYTGLLRFIKENFTINVHGFSPPELWHIARISEMEVGEVIRELSGAGLDSIPGGGAEILDDEIRSLISPHKIPVSEWLEAMRFAHLESIPTTATMMFGTIENEENILNHLKVLRELQDETGGFTAFIPWCFQPDNTTLSDSSRFLEKKDSSIRGVPGYLKILALSRIYLDNFDNMQVSWVTMGLKVAQVGLYFGANDFGSLMIEENVVRAAGVEYRVDMEGLVGAIHEGGFRPAVRNTRYELLYYP